MQRKKLKVAVVGVGGMGRAHCQTVRQRVPEMELAAIVTRDPETAAEVGRELDVPSFETVAELCAAGVAEAALIATPHPQHEAATISCLKAGLHVLCEKPLAESVAAGDRMLRTAAEMQRTLGIVFQLRFDPLFEAAFDFVASGTLGELLRASLILPDFRTQAYYNANPWRATWLGEGGGVLINQAPHLMDIFLLLTGMPEALVGHTDTTRMHDIEVEDQAEALLRYANGGVGYFYTSTVAPKHHEMFELVGTRGSLTYRGGKLECHTYDHDLVTLSRESEEVWQRPQISVVTPDVAMQPEKLSMERLMGNFARHILHGEELRCDAASGLHSLELANAIMLSSHLDAPVKLPLDRDAYEALLAARRAVSKPKAHSGKTLRVTDPTLL